MVRCLCRHRLPAHRPDLILKGVLYEIRRGRLSPAQWAEDFLRDEACQWLTLGVRPSRSRRYAFRDRRGSCVDGLNEGLIGAAVAEGLTPATQAALDGTTVYAPYPENDRSATRRPEKPCKQLPKSAFKGEAAEQGWSAPRGNAWNRSIPRLSNAREGSVCGSLPFAARRSTGGSVRGSTSVPARPNAGERSSAASTRNWWRPCNGGCSRTRASSCTGGAARRSRWGSPTSRSTAACAGSTAVVWSGADRSRLARTRPERPRRARPAPEKSDANNAKPETSSA